MIHARYVSTSRLGVTAIAALVGAGFSTAAFAQGASVASAAPMNDQAASAASMKDTVHDPRIVKSEGGEKGIWKWVVPPVRMKGAYDDHDPIGLVAGKKIPVDCSINWKDPDTHKLYCFESATSLVYFLNAPKNYEALAGKAWQNLKATPTG